MRVKVHSFLIAAMLLCPAVSRAQGPATRPAILDQIGLDQNLGAVVPLDARFVDETGKDVVLGDYFHGRPVVLALVYYQCPGLCTLVLNSTVATLKTVNLTPGEDFQVVVVSIDPKETPGLAGVKKKNYMDDYGRPATAGGWHFLTGRQEAIKKLADVVGYHYAYDPASGQFAHPAGIMVLTADGKLSRVLYGAMYDQRDVRLALVEAGQGKVGSPIDKIEMFCFKYDPTTHKYSLAIARLLQTAGGITIVGIAGLVLLLIRRERKGRGPRAKGLTVPQPLPLGPRP